MGEMFDPMATSASLLAAASLKLVAGAGELGATLDGLSSRQLFETWQKLLLADKAEMLERSVHSFIRENSASFRARESDASGTATWTSVANGQAAIHEGLQCHAHPELLAVLRARPGLWMGIPEQDLFKHPLGAALRDAELFGLLASESPAAALRLCSLPESTSPAATVIWLAQEPGKALEYLLKTGANPLLESDEGWSPLHAACALPYSDGSRAAARLLIDLGADPRAMNDEGASAIHMAAASWPWALMREELGAEPCDLLTSWGIDPAAIAMDGCAPSPIALMGAYERIHGSIRGHGQSFSEREARALEIVDAAIQDGRSDSATASLLSVAARQGWPRIFSLILNRLAQRGLPPPNPSALAPAMGRLPDINLAERSACEAGRLACICFGAKSGMNLATPMVDGNNKSTLFSIAAKHAASPSAADAAAAVEKGAALLRLSTSGFARNELLEIEREIATLAATPRTAHIAARWASELEKNLISQASSAAPLRRAASRI